MALTHQQRVSMYSTLVEVMGQEDAETLMEHLPTFDWDQVATKDDLRASELRILAELAKTNAALVKTNGELADSRVSFREALAETSAELADSRVSFREALAETNGELADAKVSFREALAKTNATGVELRGEMQLGFARLERRLAWYLVAVAALMVGFGLAVWIPLASALAEAASTALSVPVPAEAIPTQVEFGPPPG